MPADAVERQTAATPGALLASTLEKIKPADAAMLAEGRAYQGRLTKPIGALGVLEDVAVALTALAGTCPPPMPEPAAVALFAGDHGVTAQGVSAFPQEVTIQMVANFLAGGAAVNAFASQAGADVMVIDVGIAGEVPEQLVREGGPRLLRRRVRSGTADMTVEPAMTRTEALLAIETGITIADELVEDGYRCLLTGEMGIANTTPSAALIAAFTGAKAADVTGIGTGVDQPGWQRKVDAIDAALRLHRPDPSDPVGVLATVGGLEHAALAGLILGGAANRVPVILDGVIAGAAALVAAGIAGDCTAACVAGHRSFEPGHSIAMRHLGLTPLVDLGLRLGEATGALLALPLVKAGVRAMREMATFDSAGVSEKS